MLEGEQLKLKPDFIVNSIDDLTIDFFIKNNIKAVIQDIDNTLVSHGAAIDSRAKAYINMLLDNDIKLCLVTNNKKRRVVGFINGVPFISRAMKPLKWSFKKAIRIMHAKANETATIGDQIFSDIYGGNRAKTITVWVKPIRPSKEGGFVALKRYLEKRVIKNWEEN